MRPASNCIRACRSDTGVHGPDCEEEEEEEAGARLGEIRYCNKRKETKNKTRAVIHLPDQRDHLGVCHGRRTRRHVSLDEAAAAAEVLE